MAAAGKPTTTLLEEGALFDTKRMAATDGASMPRHRASAESALIVTEGQCVIRFDDEDRVLGVGDSVILPAETWHEVVADPEFTAVHIMPKGIRFTFSA